MNLTIAWITARGLFGRRRFLLLLPLPVVALTLALIAQGTGTGPGHYAGPLVDGLGFGVLLPITALIIGTGVLGSEIDDGTVVHILTKPLPRREIILAKLAVAAGMTALVSAVPMFAVGAIVSSARFGLGLAAGCLVGALGYSAVFLALSLLSRRPVLIGLGYVVLWEGLLGNLLASTQNLSIGQYVRTVADRVAGNDLLHPHVGLGVAIVMSVVFLVGGTLLAVDRLRSLTLRGETS